MKPDKVNGSVMYYDNDHVYVDANDNSKYISVTSLIDKYKSEFDSEFWASYKALEALMKEEDFSIIKKTLLATKKFNPVILGKLGINVDDFKVKKEEILASYDEERIKSCERGTTIHKVFEDAYYKSDKHDLKKFGLGGNFICKKDYYGLDLDKGIYPEYLISKISSDGILKVAGQIDLLIKDGKDIYIYDYKSNREIKQKSYYNRNKRSYECMKFPLNHIMDCNLMHYTIQLSLYAYLLQQINPEFEIKTLKLIHIDHNNKETIYELEYLKKDVEKMLNHYKKQLKIEMELNKDKYVLETNT